MKFTHHIAGLLMLMLLPLMGGCVGVHDDLDAGITLVAQQASVNILAHESFVFSVMSGGVDITGRSRIYEVTENGNIPLETAVYEPQREGAYTFIAECEGHFSAPLYLSATAVPQGGDRYLRKSLVLDFTATWCVNCPAMSQAVSAAAAMSGGRIEKIEVNYLDDLQVPAGKALADRFGVQALPHVVSGLDAALATSVASAEVIHSHNLNVFRQETPAGGISISSELSANELSVRVEVTAAAGGQYVLGAAIVEDGIVAKQTGASDSYVHNAVLRSLLHGTAPADGLGDAVGDIPEGGKVIRTFKGTVAGNAESTRIIVYLIDGSGRLNNVASCEAGGSQPYIFE